MARPSLEPAHPSRAVAGSWRPVERAVCDVLMEDGTWGHAEAIGWARDTSGAWRIQLLYYDAGSQREDWWIYDAVRVRLADPALLQDHCESCRRCGPGDVRPAPERLLIVFT